MSFYISEVIFQFQSNHKYDLIITLLKLMEADFSQCPNGSEVSADKLAHSTALLMVKYTVEFMNQ